MILSSSFFFRRSSETAINIGYSCHLLTDDMTEVFKIEGESLESVQQAIRDHKAQISGEGSTSNTRSKDNSLKDVEVEVISYRDNYIGELSGSGGVSTDSLVLIL